MQLAIAHNPHVKDPKELWSSLQDEDRLPTDDVMDKEGLLALKNMMSKGSLFEVR